MDDPSLLLRLTTEFLPLVVLLLVLTFVCHILFIFVIKLGKVGWKQADYLWLGITALGLIALAGENRRTFASVRVGAAEERVRSNLRFLRSHVEGATHFCMKFVRPENPRPDLEENQRQYDAACEWRERVLQLLPTKFEAPFPPLNFKDTQFPETITNAAILEAARGIQRMFNDYEASRTAFTDIKSS